MMDFLGKTIAWFLILTFVVHVFVKILGLS